MSDYRLVLGLEIHIQLKTQLKMFCVCVADFFGKSPNTHTCPTCLGLPGALPVPNLEAIKFTHRLGTALNCRLNQDSFFERKHYFYPDLPKGYQISQYRRPLCEGGCLTLADGSTAAVERVHIEEDTGKSFHRNGKTLIDFNKSGVPLVEIVTKPSFTSVEHAVEFSKKIHDIVRILGISDADMEKGQMRLEANISLRTLEMKAQNILPTYKVEVKNINSFKFMEKAVRAEISRQKELLARGMDVLQENRGWSEDMKTTVAQREKEESKDYRYFPDPDIPPMEFDEDYFAEIKQSVPELPEQVSARIISQYGIDEATAKLLTTGSGLSLVEKFEAVCALNGDPAVVAKLLLNRKEYRLLSAEEFAKSIQEKKETLLDERDLTSLIQKALTENPKAVGDYKKGKMSSVEFLLGQIMREIKGSMDVKTARSLIIEFLEK